MPLPRFERLDPTRQERILTAARREFAARGFGDASYNRIIREAGVSKGAMYYYFADKADLCCTLIDRFVDELAAACGALGRFASADEFWCELQTLGERAFAFVMTTPEAMELGRMIYGEGANDDVLRSVTSRTQAWCVSVLQQGQGVTAVREDLPLGFLSAAVTGALVHMDRWFAQNMESLEPHEMKRLAVSSLQMVQQIVKPQDEGSAS